MIYHDLGTNYVIYCDECSHRNEIIDCFEDDPRRQHLACSNCGYDLTDHLKNCLWIDFENTDLRQIGPNHIFISSRFKTFDSETGMLILRDAQP